MGAYGAHCVMFAPPHQSPMESSIDSTSWNSIMDSEFESMNRFGFESTMHAACLDQLRIWLLYCTYDQQKINAWRARGARARVSVNFRKLKKAEVSKWQYSSKANNSNVREGG